MRVPRLLVYETDGRLAAILDSCAKRHQWILYQPRSTNSCLRQLQRGGPAVLVLRLGRDLARELAGLDQVSWSFPETAIIAVTDHEDTALTGLIWDLGASFVLWPPWLPGELENITLGLMGAPVGAWQ